MTKLRTTILLLPRKAPPWTTFPPIWGMLTTHAIHFPPLSTSPLPLYGPISNLYSSLPPQLPPSTPLTQTHLDPLPPAPPTPNFHRLTIPPITLHPIPPQLIKRPAVTTLHTTSYDPPHHSTAQLMPYDTQYYANTPSRTNLPPPLHHHTHYNFTPLFTNTKPISTIIIYNTNRTFTPFHHLPNPTLPIHYPQPSTQHGTQRYRQQ